MSHDHAKEMRINGDPLYKKDPDTGGSTGVVMKPQNSTHQSENPAVNPKHYRRAGIVNADGSPFLGPDGQPFQVIHVIEMFELNFNMGTVCKYLLRCGQKDDPIQDLDKLIWYAKREQERIRKAREDQTIGRLSK